MQRPGLPATGSILDDPAYRKLGPAEQLAVLDALEKDPTALISMGFGAYAKSLESSAAVEYKSAQKDVQYDPLKMPGFLCGVLRLSCPERFSLLTPTCHCQSHHRNRLASVDNQSLRAVLIAKAQRLASWFSESSVPCQVRP